MIIHSSVCSELLHHRSFTKRLQSHMWYTVYGILTFNFVCLCNQTKVELH